MRLLAAIGALALAGCELTSAGASPVDCASSDNCGADQVCFFARCVNPGDNIASVHMDLTPPNDSGLLSQVDSESPRDLNAGSRQDVTLRSSVAVEGTVRAGSTDIDGTLIANRYLASGEARLPSTAQPIRATTGVGGFALALVPGTYTIELEPSAAELPPIALYTSDSPLATDDAGPLALVYRTNTRTLSGRVVVSSTNSTPQEQLEVIGIAQDSAGRDLRSTTARTDPFGRYSLVFPPDASPPFSITIQPGANPLGVRATKTLMPTGDVFGDFALDLTGSAPVAVTAQIRAGDGVGVANASVLFRGTVDTTETDASESTFVASASSNAEGFLFDEPLWKGVYDITVAPPKTQPYALGFQRVCIGAEFAAACNGDFSEDSVSLEVGTKARLVGNVFSHDGEPVPNARITATLREIRTAEPRVASLSREFSTTTRADGGYSLEVDPGAAGAPASYEIIIEPQQIGSSPLPRYRDIIDVDDREVQEQPFTLYDASLIHGRIYDPAGRPLANVRVGVYATESPFGSPEQPLLVGLGQSSENGEFVVPIPVP